MSRRTCCSMILVLGMVLALFAVAGPSQAAIQTAGSLLINLDAETLGVANGAEVTAWPNAGTAGGTFVPDPAPASGNIGTPNMATLAIGQSAVSKKVVRFQAVAPGDFSATNVDCLQLDAAQVPTALTSDAPTFSVEFWAYKVGTFGNQSAVSWGRRAQSDYRAASPVTGSSGAAAAYFHTATAVSGRAITIGDGTAPDGFPAFGAGYTPVYSKFTHFTYTYNTANKQLKFYINGVLNRSMTCNNWWPAAGFPMYLGMSRATYGSNTGNPLGGISWSTEDERRAACLNFLHSSLDGGIAKLRIHSGVLGAGQVWNNYTFEAPDYVLTADMPPAPVFAAPQIDTASIPATILVKAGLPFSWGPAPILNPGSLSLDPTWALTTNPAGMTINPATGVIAWASPTAGDHPVAFTATTPEGSDAGSFILSVVAVHAGAPIYDGNIISVDAADLAVGTVTTWPNTAATGGQFTRNGGAATAAIFPTPNGNSTEVVNMDGAAEFNWSVLPIPDSIAGNNSWTMEAWVAPVNPWNWRTIVGWGNRWYPNMTDSTEAELAVFGTGEWGIYTCTGGGPSVTGVEVFLTETGAPVVDGSYHHLVGTYDGGTGTLTFYRDGAPKNSTVVPAPLQLGNDKLRISGNLYPTSDGWSRFQGAVGRVRVHSVALSAAQVAENYNAEKPDFATLGAFVLTKPAFFDMMVFWDAVAGETSPAQDLAFRNDGDGDLTITDALLTGDYVTVPALTPPVVVPGHTEFTVQVAAQPTTTDEAAGSLVLSYTNGFSPGEYTLDLLTNPSSAYVSTTGNDTTGNGLLATPYKTIQKAIDVSTRLGASVRVLAGSYASFSVPGSSDALMKIAAPNGGVTVTNGPVDFAATSGKTAIVQVKGVNFVPTSAAADTDPIIRTGGDGALVLSIEGATISSANLGTKSPTLVGALDTSTLDLDLNLTDCVLNGADVSNGVWVQYGTRVDINILRSTINHTDNAVIRNVTGALLIQESTIDTTIGKAVYAGGFLPGNTDPGNWWWASNGPVTLDRCYIVNIGGFYNAGVSADITLSAVFLFTDAEGRDTVTNNVFEGCNAGIQGGWTWDTSFMHVFNNTFIAHTGLTSVGTGVFDDADHFGYLAYNNVVLGFATSISAGDPLTLSNNFDETSATMVNANFRYQAGGAYALPTGVVGVNQLVPVEPSALTAAGVYAAGVPREDYYGGARSTTAPYIGAFEGVWSAPAIEAIPTQIAVLGRPFATLAPTLTAGYPPSTWTLNAAAIAAGMTVDSATGVVSWANPGPVAQYPVILTATNAVGAGSVSFTVKVLSQPPAAATYWYLFE